MATEKITIIVEEKGSIVVKRSMQELGTGVEVVDKRVQNLKKSTLDLRGVFAGLGAYLGVSALISYSDAATRLSNTLKLAGLSGQEFTNVQERIYQSGIRNGQNAESLGAIYLKLATQQKELKASGEDIIGVTEGIGAAMRMSTAGTGAQQGALQQLSQSFGGYKIQAQEYNSLIDGAYPLLQAAANGSDRWAGSVSKLSQDVKASNVLTKDFFDALKIGLKDTEALAASMPLTVGQAFASLETAFTRFLANSDSAKGAAGALSKAISFVANNIETLANILIPVITLIGVNFAITAVGAAISGLLTLGTTLISVTSSVVALSAALLANPITLVVLAVTALGVALYNILDYFLAGTQAWDGWKQSAVKAVDDVKKAFSGILSFMGGNGAPPKIEVTADKAGTQLKEAGLSIEQRIRSGADYSASAMRGSFETGGDTVSNSIVQAGVITGTGLRGSIEIGGATVATTWRTVFGDFLGGLIDWAASFFSTASNAATGPTAGLDGQKTDAAAKKLGDGVKAGSDKGAASMGGAVDTAGASAGASMGSSTTAAGSQAGSSMASGTATGGNSAAGAMNSGVTSGGRAAASAMASAITAAGANAAARIAAAMASGGSGNPGTGFGQTSPGGTGTGYAPGSAGATGFSWSKAPTDYKYLQFARGGDFKVGGNGGTDSQKVGFMASPDEVVSVRTPAQVNAEKNNPAPVGAGNAKPVTINNIFDPQASVDAMNSQYGQEVIFNTVRNDPDKFRRALGLPS